MESFSALKLSLLSITYANIQGEPCINVFACSPYLILKSTWVIWLARQFNWLPKLSFFAALLKMLLNLHTMAFSEIYKVFIIVILNPLIVVIVIKIHMIGPLILYILRIRIRVLFLIPCVIANPTIRLFFWELSLIILNFFSLLNWYWFRHVVFWLKKLLE